MNCKTSQGGHFVVKPQVRFAFLTASADTASTDTAFAVVRIATLLLLASVSNLLSISSSVMAQDSSEEAIATYADAANFQTNGAIDLAIESWKTFLKEFPNDPMAPKAAHYLGVCYMQQDEPDYVAASTSFAQALKAPDYDLREESLANHGWCLYSAAGEAPNRDEGRLRSAIEAFEKLQKDFPESTFLDRALFYGGEAAYGLGDAKKAIANYDQLLALPSAKDSPLRCDALYARGVAYEELDEFDNAVASFKQLLSSCAKNDLVTDVHIRLGDTAILKKDYGQAIESFENAINSTESDDDKSYAIFRQAFALVQANKPKEAAEKYELLIKSFPDSQYAATAILASAQSTYRSGDIDEAAKRFQKVLEQKNPEASTEAAHWLARIFLSKGDAQKAKSVAKTQLDGGAQGKYVLSLKLDLAEALSMNPETLKESLDAFEKAYRESPSDELAPRALYNAAFSALQLGDPKKSIELATEFLSKFPKDILTPDVRAVAAESNLALGKPAEAVSLFKELIKNADPKDTVQRPLWVLRAATSMNAAGQTGEVAELLKNEASRLPDKAQRAEAQLILGQAYLMTQKPAEAAKAYRASYDADPKWGRAIEALLMSGQALFVTGDKEGARKLWEKIVSDEPTGRMADQARFKLAQLSTTEKKPKDALKFYDEILTSKQDPGLMPYAYYGRAQLLMENKEFEQALTSLDPLLKDNAYPDLRPDALLARGITLRNLDKLEPARKDLEAFLQLKPQGINLGHALYELALIDQKEKKPEKAAERLQQLAKEVPNYPGSDKVLYELGWSQREAGNNEQAIKTFTKLIETTPDTAYASEAAYFVGQSFYENEKWDEAAKYFALAAKNSGDDKLLSEKAHYRLGWSLFKAGKMAESANAFQQQAAKHGDGMLGFDALMMVGECYFNESKYQEALVAYEDAKKRIIDKDENAKTLRDAADRQSRELVLLHGGQSAAQLKKWDVSIQWYDELRNRFPATNYLAQVFYEIGFAYQQSGDKAQALKMFGEVADNYRNELAARARFMIGEIHFGNNRYDLAIPEFQKVMFGFGAEKAPESIKNWQAKSGFEAGRCSELLLQQAKTNEAKKRAFDYANRFYQYVTTKHPQHELAEKSTARLEALKTK